MGNAYGLMSLDEVLEALGEPGKPLPKSTFFRWKSRGQAPKSIKYPNGALRFRTTDLDRWLKSREER
jgi:predicted DNA-binding transcriptional regulator AlpA